jgi:hypothetical protein
MSIDEAIERLYRHRKLSSQDDVEHFETALSALAAADLTDAEMRRLFAVFSDDCAYQDVLWGLLHFLESRDVSRFVETYVAELENMQSDAAEWAETIACRIVNVESLSGQLQAALHRHGAPAVTAFRAVTRKVIDSNGKAGLQMKQFIETLHG